MRTTFAAAHIFDRVIELERTFSAHCTSRPSMTPKSNNYSI